MLTVPSGMAKCRPPPPLSDDAGAAAAAIVGNYSTPQRKGRLLKKERDVFNPNSTTLPKRADASCLDDGMSGFEFGGTSEAKLGLTFSWVGSVAGREEEGIRIMPNVGRASFDIQAGI